MYFSDFMSKEELHEHLSRQIDKHTDKCRYLSDVMEQNHNNKVPPFGTREYGDYMVLEGAIIHEESYIQWLENCLKRV